MHPKELQSSEISKALFGLFIDLFNKIKKTDEFIKLYKIKDATGYLYDASVIEQKI